jgi:hypothetical protein
MQTCSAASASGGFANIDLNPRRQRDVARQHDDRNASLGDHDTNRPFQCLRKLFGIGNQLDIMAAIPEQVFRMCRLEIIDFARALLSFPSPQRAPDEGLREGVPRRPSRRSEGRRLRRNQGRTLITYELWPSRIFRSLTE